MAVATPSYVSASLYVGDLISEVTEALLFEVFSGVGPVASVRVCRDAATRRSLGYAYVNFHRVEDAERALDTMNFKAIRGRPCRIMWSHRDPSLRKSGVGNIFVKNLSPDIDNKALYDTFSIVGNILSCKVACNKNRESLGYGFVHYESEESAQKAIAEINGKEIDNQQVTVQAFKSKKERGASTDAVFTNLYVKNIGEDATEEAFKELFTKHGDITSSALAMDKETNKPRGFGFVCFTEPEAAAAAVEALNDFEWNGKKLFVGRAQKRDEREKELRERFEQLKVERQKKYEGVNLYVKNLTDGVTEDRLREEFKQFGEIKSCKLMTDSAGKSKGFGFVCFATPEEAEAAIKALHNQIMDGKPLYVSQAQRKEVRRQQLEAQHNNRGMKGGPQGPPQMYPGQMFYAPGMAPPRNYMYPQQMMPRRWNGQPGQPGQPMMGPGGRHPNQQYQLMPVPNNQRGPQQGQQRGQGRNNRRNAQGKPNQQMQRGQRQQQQQQPQQFQQQPAQEEAAPAQAEGQHNSFIRDLLQKPVEEQKNMIGERLYPLIAADERVTGDRAGKITGMLLEMDNTEIISLLDSKDALSSRIEEAVQVLERADAEAQ